MSISGLSYYFGFSIGNDWFTNEIPAAKPEETKKAKKEKVQDGPADFDYSYGTSPSKIYGAAWKGNVLSPHNLPKYPNHNPNAKP